MIVPLPLKYSQPKHFPLETCETFSLTNPNAEEFINILLFYINNNVQSAKGVNITGNPSNQPTVQVPPPSNGLATEKKADLNKKNNADKESCLKTKNKCENHKKDAKIKNYGREQHMRKLNTKL